MTTNLKTATANKQMHTSINNNQKHDEKNLLLLNEFGKKCTPAVFKQIH